MVLIHSLYIFIEIQILRQEYLRVVNCGQAASSATIGIEEPIGEDFTTFIYFPRLAVTHHSILPS